MAHPIPTTEPKQLVIGDLWTWKKSLANYPADDSWILSYSMRRVGTPVIDFSASASGADHLVSVAAATTAAFTAGRHNWEAKITKAAEVYFIAKGEIEILPDLSAEDNTYDPRSHARKALDAICATLEGTAKHEQSSLTVEGLSLGIASRAELYDLKMRYQEEVRQEEAETAAAAGLANPAKVRLRFPNFR